MFIVDGVCYADSNMSEIKVKDAQVLRGGMLLVTFTSGEKRLFDTTKLEGSAFEPLKNDKILRDITIFHGVITWNNGEIDIAPETVYAESYPYDSTSFAV